MKTAIQVILIIFAFLYFDCALGSVRKVKERWFFFGAAFILTAALVATIVLL